MKIYATSDLHLDQPENLEAFNHAFPENNINAPEEACLILAGDICETVAQLDTILGRFKKYYQHLVWVPGNHELWIRPGEARTRYQGRGSPAKYEELLEICRKHGVFTPEDPYLEVRSGEEHLLIVPVLTLYDYSFNPNGLSPDKALEWAMESNVLCTDEVLLVPRPYSSVVDWCNSRVEITERRLASSAQEDQAKLILVNHFPVLESSFHLEHIPRFSIWCGTKKTERWHLEYPVKAVINGHLHLPGRKKIDGIDFYEVSLGYPGQWDERRSMKDFFFEIEA